MECSLIFVEPRKKCCYSNIFKIFNVLNVQRSQINGNFRGMFLEQINTIQQTQQLSIAHLLNHSNSTCDRLKMY